MAKTKDSVGYQANSPGKTKRSHHKQDLASTAEAGRNKAVVKQKDCGYIGSTIEASPLCVIISALLRNKCYFNSQLDPITGRVNQILLCAQIPLGRLDRRVTQ
jgi:hypothetical protein